MSASTVITDYLKIFAGTPTGVPPVNTGAVAFGWDDTNKLLYAYSWTASAWKPAGGGGSSFSPFNDAGAFAITKPVASAFTLTQSSSLSGTAAKADLVSRGVSLRVPVHTTGGTDNIATIGQAPPATTFTLTMLLHRNFAATNRGYDGIYVKDSAGKYLVTGWNQSQDTVSAWSTTAWSSSFGFSSTVATFAAPEGQVYAPYWLRMQQTSTTIVMSISMDGENFTPLYTGTLSGITTQYNGTPSEVGLFLDANDNSSALMFARSDKIMNIYSFTMTNP